VTRYQLAKIVEWVGTFRSRKRMQKMVYLLKVAGFPTDAEYFLHIYGPYSFDLASLTNEMAQIGLLVESEKPATKGSTFDYCLSDHAIGMLRELDASERGQQLQAEIAQFEPLVCELAQVDVSQLEVAATIVYLEQRGSDLESACIRLCEIKRLVRGSELMTRAVELVERFGALKERMAVVGGVHTGAHGESEAT
jgi:uncharacterized protein YwgA